MTYTDQPPTEPGWYWLRRKIANVSFFIAEKNENGDSWTIDGDDEWEERQVRLIYEFGPRVLTPDEVAKLISENLEWLKAARMLCDPETESRGIAAIDELRLGNSDVRIPDDIQVSLRERLDAAIQQRDAAEAELEQLRNELAEIHEAWGLETKGGDS